MKVLRFIYEEIIKALGVFLLLNPLVVGISILLIIFYFIWR